MNRQPGIFLRIAIFFIVLINPAVTLAQELVEVRSGRHPTFSRIVFDWQEMVSYTPDLSGDRLEIIFDKASIPNWNNLKNKPLAHMSGPEYHIDGERLIVTLKVTSPSLLKHFRVGTKIAFDIIGNDVVSEDLRTSDAVEVTSTDISPPCFEPAEYSPAEFWK